MITTTATATTSSTMAMFSSSDSRHTFFPMPPVRVQLTVSLH
jgi:hypothetical protein